MNLDNLILEYLVPIIRSECKNLSKDVEYYSKIIAAVDNNKKCDLNACLGKFQYLFELHSALTKDSMNSPEMRLDRHKMSAVLFVATIEFSPVTFKNDFDSLQLEAKLINYKIAFRFACIYAAYALYSSFIYKINNPDKFPNTEIYISAKEKLKKQAILYFPTTRDGLNSFIENYVKAIYLQTQQPITKKIYPYALIADTFYWLDIYNKLILGIEVKPQ